jgi:hypothetical protein
MRYILFLVDLLLGIDKSHVLIDKINFTFFERKNLQNHIYYR